MRKAGGVLIILVAVLALAPLWSGEPVAELWQRTYARPCPADAASPDCLATRPGRIDYRSDKPLVADSDLVAFYVRVQDPPTHLYTYEGGGAFAYLPPESAARLGITWLPDGTPVQVTVFGSDIVAVTGPNGVTADAEDVNDPIFAANLMVVVLTAVAGLVLAAGGYLWRRWRGGTTEWIGQAAWTTVIGAVAAAIVGAIAAGRFGVVWAMPVTYGVMIAVSLAFLRVRHPLHLRERLRRFMEYI